MKRLKNVPPNFLPFIDRRAFGNGKNPFTNHEGGYEPGLGMTEAEFYSHHLLDTRKCTEGARARFNAVGVKRYLIEKTSESEDSWVARGNEWLSEMLERHIAQDIERFRGLAEIRILDFGPSGGAITTLFALRALARHGLLDKVRITLLDVVPNVVNMTIAGDFEFSPDIVARFRLQFAGEDGQRYKEILSRATPVIADFHDYVPEKRFHVILNAYTIHHLNIFDKKDGLEWMMRNLEPKGIMAVVDFYIKNFHDYMAWLKAHMTANPHSAPPIESPYFSMKQVLELAKLRLGLVEADERLEKSWAFIAERSG